MSKGKLIIVEGAQGSYKTTVTRKLKSKMLYTVLLALTGVEDTSRSGSESAYFEHLSVLNMVDNCKGAGFNFVLDRSHLTEQVYNDVGYNDHNFRSHFDGLNSYLNHLADDYDVHVYVLTASEASFLTRLQRDKPNFANVTYSASNSLLQQDAYVKLLDEMKSTYSSIHCKTIPTDGISSDAVVEYILKDISES